MTNQRKKAAQAANELRDAMEEILGTPGYEDGDIETKRHASAALNGIEEAEEALRMWRDREEEPVELLGEEPRDGEQEKHIDGGVVEINGERWRLGAALRAVADGDLAVEDVLAAVEDS